MDELVRKKEADKVTWVGFFTNLILTGFKLFAGIVGHSNAMIADAIHSLSDFATDIVVLGSFQVVCQPKDADHDYGHGKFETLASTIVSVALFFVGGGIFYNGAASVVKAINGVQLEAPGVIALVAAVISIIFKEYLYRYTVIVGKKINSNAVIANAWHHRSDAFSSIGTMVGIGGAIILGDQWRVLDPIASIIVSLFIFKVAWDIAKGSLGELMETSLTESEKQTIMALVLAVPGVSDPHNLKTRHIGNAVAIDIHIRVNPDSTVKAAHAITVQIENGLRGVFGQNSFISVHVEPE